ncbi:hypothetical protein Tco_1507786 [Tanacetum coccineum]
MRASACGWFHRQTAVVRIEKTKRSKNDQKPTRNGKKTKSQEQDKEFSQRSQPDQPDSVKDRNKGSQKPKVKSRGHYCQVCKVSSVHKKI